VRKTGSTIRRDPRCSDYPLLRAADRGQAAQQARGAAFFTGQAKVVAQQQDRVEDARQALNVGERAHLRMNHAPALDNLNRR
jgi:hypothetical protein